ncbi:MAG: hypothetical protein HY709_05535, partial [Candidatus Latescibacteria bacterium]|nr:hypothetical protein [Candidatus Latescibacterota bacterium]
MMVGLFITGLLEARPPIRQTGPAAKPVVLDNDTKIDVNNISMIVTNQGSYAFDVEGSSAGLEFPKGTGNTAVFASGLWIGGKVNDEIRVAAAEFSFEFRPGVIVNGQPANMEDPRYHVYKISRGDGPENPDWKDWPVTDGAPVDKDGKPLVLGDQTLWAVYNDADQAWHQTFSTNPLGIEVQQTTFAFNRTGALGNTIFLKLLMTNKGGNRIDSTFVSIWVDPDLGQFDDDLVGADVEKSLGFCYNSTNADAVYGAAPPSVGFDFFKGPIGDDGVELPMASFNKYINGTDPQSGLEVYNYMRGFDKDGNVQVDPVTGQETKFMLSGDPVTGTGWLDENPADRRLMLSAGPFTFDPGESQEVVAAIVIGQGKDRLTSITAMRFFDSFAQAAFDANFGLPTPPTKPNVTVTPLGDPGTGHGKIVLTWDDVSEKSMTEEYVFEGYNVYQGASIAGPWKRITTFDVKNEITIIFDEEFDVDAGVVVSKPVQFGGDTGLKHFFEVKEDFITGGPLANGKTYFFAVTAYAYNPGGAPRVLETPPAPLMDGRTRPVRFAIDPGQVEPVPGIIPRSPTAGSDVGVAGVFRSGKIDSAATHTTGVSDGEVTVRVIDPSKVTGNAYQVRFREVEQPSPDDPSVMVPVMVWDLFNTTKGTPVLSDLPENDSAEEGEANPIVDGLLVKAIGPPAGIQ